MNNKTLLNNPIIILNGFGKTEEKPIKLKNIPIPLIKNANMLYKNVKGLFSTDLYFNVWLNPSKE